MLKTLIHWWRLCVEPSGKGRLLCAGKRRWCVRYYPTTEYAEFSYSIPLAYDVACEYASMFHGEVERIKENK